MRQRQFTTKITVHHSLASKTSMKDIMRWHVGERGFEDSGYHFLVRKSGLIEPGRDLRNVGAHKIGDNTVSVGAVFEGDFRTETPTADQYDSFNLLRTMLTKVYGPLPVEPHRRIGNKCPGKNFDFNLI